MHYDSRFDFNTKIVFYLIISLTGLLLSTCTSPPSTQDISQSYYNLGILFAGQKDYAQAADNYRKSLEMNPANRQARYNLGQVLVSQGKFDEAIPIFERLLSEDPGNMMVAEAHAFLLAKQGKLLESFDIYEKVEANTEGRVQVLTNLVTIGRKLSLFSRAWPFAEKLAALNPDDMNIKKTAGLFAKAAGKDSDADVLIKDYLDSIKSDVTALLAFSTELGTAKFDDLEGQVIERAIQVDPKNSKSLFTQTQFWIKKGFPTEKITAQLTKALEAGFSDREAIRVMIKSLKEADVETYMKIVTASIKDFTLVAAPVASGNASPVPTQSGIPLIGTDPVAVTPAPLQTPVTSPKLP